MLLLLLTTLGALAAYRFLSRILQTKSSIIEHGLETQKKETREGGGGEGQKDEEERREGGMQGGTQGGIGAGKEGGREGGTVKENE